MHKLQDVELINRVTAVMREAETLGLEIEPVKGGFRIIKSNVALIVGTVASIDEAKHFIGGWKACLEAIEPWMEDLELPKELFYKKEKEKWGERVGNYEVLSWMGV